MYRLVPFFVTFAFFLAQNYALTLLIASAAPTVKTAMAIDTVLQVNPLKIYWSRSLSASQRFACVPAIVDAHFRLSYLCCTESSAPKP